MLLIDGIGCLPAGVQEASLSFPLTARRYEKPPAALASSKAFSQRNQVSAGTTTTSVIPARILNHRTVVSIKGRSAASGNFKLTPAGKTACGQQNFKVLGFHLPRALNGLKPLA